MYRPVLVTPPAIKPASLTEAKAALDVSYTDKDTLIGGLIDAATSYLDGYTGILGRALCEQTWRQDYDDFRSCLRLPIAPAISITSVKYTDTDGVEQTVDAANYVLRTDALSAYVEFAAGYSFPSLNVASSAVRVTYLAGYATVDGAWSGPAAIKQAILLLVRHWFDNPSAVQVGNPAQVMPLAVEALIAPFRRVGV